MENPTDVIPGYTPCERFCSQCEKQWRSSVEGEDPRCAICGGPLGPPILVELERAVIESARALAREELDWPGFGHYDHLDALLKAVKALEKVAGALPKPRDDGS